MARRLIGVGHGSLSTTFPRERARLHAAISAAAAAAGSTLAASGDGGVTLLINSHWNHGLGNGQTAVSDDNLWPDFTGTYPSNALTVVEGSTVGWTLTPNVLRILQGSTSQYGLLMRNNLFTASTDIYFRTWIRNDQTTSAGQLHATCLNGFPQGNGTSSIELTILGQENTSTSWTPVIRPYNSPGGSPYSNNPDHWYWELIPANRLTQGVWYRYELWVQFLTANRYRVWPRIYSMAGDLIRDYTHFRSAWNTALTLSGVYGSNADNFGLASTAAGRHLTFGQEGNAGSPNSGQYWYQAAVAASHQGWIGDQLVTA